MYGNVWSCDLPCDGRALCFDGCILPVTLLTKTVPRGRRATVVGPSKARADRLRAIGPLRQEEQLLPQSDRDCARTTIQRVGPLARRRCSRWQAMRRQRHQVGKHSGIQLSHD